MFDDVRSFYAQTFGEPLKLSDNDIDGVLTRDPDIGVTYATSGTMEARKGFLLMHMSAVLEALNNAVKSNPVPPVRGEFGEAMHSWLGEALTAPSFAGLRTKYKQVTGYELLLTSEEIEQELRVHTDYSKTTTVADKSDYIDAHADVLVEHLKDCTPVVQSHNVVNNIRRRYSVSFGCDMQMDDSDAYTLVRQLYNAWHGLGIRPAFGNYVGQYAAELVGVIYAKDRGVI